MGFDLGNFLFGGPRNAGQDLADAGYKQYDPNSAAYKGINPNLGQANVSGADPYTQSQQTLIQKLQGVGAGPGATAADAQLRAGTDAAVRAQAGMAAANNPQAGGAAAYQQAMGAGNAISNVSNQAAQLRAQEEQARNQLQLGGLSAAGGLAGQGVGQQIQLGESNAANALNAGQYNSNTQIALEQQRQAEADARNKEIAAGVQGSQNSGGLLGSAVKAAGSVAAMMGDGGIVYGPTTALIGEKGPEAVVPLKEGSLGRTLAALSYMKGTQDAHAKIVETLERLWGNDSKKHGAASGVDADDDAEDDT